MKQNHKDLIERAKKAFARRPNDIRQEPSTSSSVEGDHVILRNVRGELARYRILPSGKLKFVEPK